MLVGEKPRGSSIIEILATAFATDVNLAGFILYVRL
jgi:hypothetical protein